MPPILEAKDCVMRFSGLTAVKNFSCSLEPGHIYGLIGTNGAGKTTVINMLSGVLRPTAGKIIFDGKDITGVKPHKIAHLGIVRTYQNLRLFNKMTVLENVIIGAQIEKPYHMVTGILQLPRYHEKEKELRDKAMEKLEIMGVSEYANAQAGSLPYGLQRRLEIARALATQPELLLLDEPAAGMNPQETEDLMKMIRFVRDHFKIAVLLIEHDMKLVMGICERITVLNYGMMLAQGLPEEIQANPAVIKAYLGE